MKRALPLVVLMILCVSCADEAVLEGSDSGLSRSDASVDLDAYVPPIRPDAQTAEDQFGTECEQNSDCVSGYCIESPTGGRICSRRCGDCPDGYECEPITNGGADRTLICLADRPDLCNPCEQDRDCDDNGDLCLAIGNNRYCGEDCATDGWCPDGYECIDVMGEGDAGVVAQQCVPAGGEGCQPCADSDGDGYGDGGDCLGFDCNDDDPTVFEGAPELCDGVDNNCNSLVDEFESLGSPPEDLECLTEGVCFGSRVACLAGGWACDYPESYEADAERSCDGLDNDCDGVRDDDIDLTSDPANCAFCGNACLFQNADGLCVESSCELGPCAEGWHNVDGNDGNGCEYGCVTTREGVESCDDIDNDCDGAVDEDFDLQNNVANCGGCNRACELLHAQPQCVEGVCGIQACEEGWVDQNQIQEDGCEFECVFSNDGVEICDDIDNDCDGRVDEDFDKVSGLDHCGGCGQVCAFEHGVAQCDDGRCGLAGCLDGWHDANGDANDGCEYGCIVSRGGEEACDTIDNDCDARIDEETDTNTDVAHCGGCGRACLFANGAPVCANGTCGLGDCAPGFWNNDGVDANGCEYACVQNNGGAEICDLTDNDCDGRLDEDFDVNTDVLHCGRCNNECILDNASPRCAAGDCRIRECLGGFHDANGDPNDGCEYACQPSNGGVEVCDNIDNDCDTIADNNAPVNTPEHCGECFNRCDFTHGVAECANGSCALAGCEAGWIDLDGQAGNGCEYECTFIGDADEPDDEGVDRNCDGIDGDLDRAIFVRLNGDNDLGGQTPETAVATVARAIALADALPGRDQILVESGTYSSSSTLTLRGGMKIYGGYSNAFRVHDDGAHSVLEFTSRIGAQANNLNAALELDNINIRVTDRQTTAEEAIALTVLDSGNRLTIRDGEIRAGRGANGSNGGAGGAGDSGTPGNNASGSTGGLGRETGGGLGATGERRDPGPAGSPGAANGSPAGGSGGAGSGGGGLGCNDGDPRPGGNGGNGRIGNVGARGGHGSTVGNFNGDNWSAARGATGSRGGTGGGGGGGGAGGGEDCRVLGQCVYCGTGRGGGGGGGGGEGGAGGQGGLGGGASIAILLQDSTVTLRGTTLRTDGGGNGGNGGSGGSGGGGGDGGSGANSSDNDEGDGGDGGSGGQGGTGGCGGGGGGGPSYGLWGLGGATVHLRDGSNYNIGNGGTGGLSCGLRAGTGSRGNSRSVNVD